jgi:DNA polymerase/3'-5' exonuclease PolX
MKFRGIGKSIAACIDEILETGTTERLQHPEERDRIIEKISKIVGFNYSKARDLVDKYHVHTMDDLQKVELTKEQKIGKL